MSGSVADLIDRGTKPEEVKSWPWKHYTPLSDIYKQLPTFAIIEVTYRVMAWSCLVHAFITNNIPMWFGAILCGTANDCWFMHLPLCNNFWQAQASIMLTARLPLYIPEVYVTIIYSCSIAARQLSLPFVSEAALTGLLAHVLYGVYDINGPPFLWWTWHDGDPAIRKRFHNAPFGSSLWILTYISTTELLMRFVESPVPDSSFVEGVQRLSTSLHGTLPWLADMMAGDRIGQGVSSFEIFQQNVSTSPWYLRFAFVSFVCTPIFITFMGIFQVLSFDTLGVPGKRTYALALAIFIVIAGAGFKQTLDGGSLYTNELSSFTLTNWILFAEILAFYFVNLFVHFVFDPRTHVSTGCHQKFGKSKKAWDIMSIEREDHLDSRGPYNDSVNDYSFIDPSEDGKFDKASQTTLIYPKNEGVFSEWYTVRGKRRLDWNGDTRILIAFTTIGILGFGVTLTKILA